jgi:short-subunit dehydrogenase
MGTLGTALITGASSGIGEAYARNLAASGYDLALVARREDRLRELADSYREQFGVTVEIVPADLTQDEDIDRVAAYIKESDDLSMLVNSAGFSYLGYFADFPLQQNLDMLKLHLEANLRLSYAAVHKMREKQHGAIITVSSIMAFLPTANNATYNATKAFLLSFCDALSHEEQENNIRVQVICPGFTRTNLFDAAGVDTSSFTGFVPSFAWMQPDEVVIASLSALGRKKRVVIPGYFNRIFWAFLVFPPTGNLMKWFVRRLGAPTAAI